MAIPLNIVAMHFIFLVKMLLPLHCSSLRLGAFASETRSFFFYIEAVRDEAVRNEFLVRNEVVVGGHLDGHCCWDGGTCQ
jgi:hypothetical protein